MPRYAALLDACVLVPIALADTLLRVAALLAGLNSGGHSAQAFQRAVSW